MDHETNKLIALGGLTINFTILSVTVSWATYGLTNPGSVISGGFYLTSLSKSYHGSLEANL